MRVLHIISACSDLKRCEPGPRQHLGAHPHGKGRLAAWCRALSSARHVRLPAAEMYLGNHWSIATTLPGLAIARGWDKAVLWVASAGYGLARQDEPLVAYGATFRPHHADSVIDASSGEAHAEQQAQWWCDVNERLAGMRQRPNLGVRGPGAGSAVLVIASRHYVDAMVPTLLAWRKRLDGPDRLIVVSTRIDASHELARNAVNVTEAHDLPSSGPLVSLHARAASSLIASISPGRFGMAASLRHAEDRWPVVSRTRVQRPRVTDDDVLTFIQSRLAGDPDASASALVRAIRDAGIACEQHRFRRLFQSLQETA